MKKTAIIAMVLGVCACTVQIEPLEMKKNSPQAPLPTDKLTQQPLTKYYECKEGQMVRVVYQVKNKKSKLQSISLTFKHATHKLTETISEQGKKYADIHWHWIERQDYATLTNVLGDVLAEQCVRK